MYTVVSTFILNFVLILVCLVAFCILFFSLLEIRRTKRVVTMLVARLLKDQNLQYLARQSSSRGKESDSPSEKEKK